uniref:4-alpha-glucanotransferase n=1 Tax=candidate division WOR-3 bacterium TaxID=2052148 RepID=A0A7C4UBQ4_UNCW3
MRKSGILLHISSLPSQFGIGDFGESSYRFADFLFSSGQTLWQILPLNPTLNELGNSPYNSYSTFAGNKLFISPELLLKDGLLKDEDLSFDDNDKNRIDYRKVHDFKDKIISIAFERFKPDKEYEIFCYENSFWLDDFALFTALKRRFNGKVWSDWEDGLKWRNPDTLNYYRNELMREIDKEKFAQFIFYKQWRRLKKYCNDKGIQIIGDLPIYVSYNSSDVWMNPDIFKLDGNLKPISVAGVPPDYFSKTGQLWGNPVYNWHRLRERGYDWWIRRIGFYMREFDFIRIDHFRGFCGFWEIPYGEKTAVNGRWEEGPKNELFDRILLYYPNLPIIAEDLGVITPDVRELINYYGFLCMKVLVFAFSGDISKNPYIPHNHTENSVVYSGTHDTDTVLGWFRNAKEEERENLNYYVGYKVKKEFVNWVFIRLGMMSVSRYSIFPLQDIMNLDSSSRMNTPGTNEGNWCWRYNGDFDKKIAETLLKLTRIYRRI